LKRLVFGVTPNGMTSVHLNIRNGTVCTPPR